METPLRRARQQAGLTQVDLAALTGVSEGLVREIEAGRRSLSLSLSSRIGDAMQIDGVELYARHVLDEWAMDIATTDLESIPTALAKIRRALSHYAELEVLEELPDPLRIEIRDLAHKTAAVLAGLSRASTSLR